MIVQPLPLLLGFVFGWSMVFLTKPEKRVVYVYPTNHNSGGVEYKDRAGLCYVYDSKPVPCPSNPNKIPLQ
tara:strand:- start:1558 stop:1770 length:213 start_codon:yes stop_codon:yes gene_type:complete